MAEFFKGLFDRRSPAQKSLDEMLDNYAKGGTQAHRDTAATIKTLFEYSPDLKARTLEVVGDGHLRSYSDHGVQVGGSASYHVHDRSIRVGPSLDPSRGENIPMEKMFMLGHETEHARSLKGVNYAERTLVPAIERLADSPSAGPRDYTPIVAAYVERTRTEEGRAHLGGFNAVASFIMKHHTPEPGQVLRDLYEAHPARMGDFIAKTSDGVPATYALKPGLTIGDNGLLPYSEQNIAAMKIHYADKAQLGAAHMNYRQDSIEFVSGVVKQFENDRAERRMEDRDFIIDPSRLQAHPLLGLPEDGRLQAKGAIPILKLDLSDSLPPLRPSSAASVPLEAQPGDPPLFAQALAKVVEHHRTDKLSDDPQELRNLAASLAVAAHAQGLTRIERMILSADSTGVIVSQGDGAMRQNARVEGLEAMSTPEATSLARLPAPVQSASPSEERQASIAIADSPVETPKKQLL
jgi:hypothetical protein